MDEEKIRLSPPKVGTLASAHMDAIRGLAAVLVFLSHWRMLFLVNYPQVQGSNALLHVFYWLTHFGHQAVMAFFVLSGYLVGGSALRMMRRGWSWKEYLLNRLTRLWMVLIPALLLGGLWDLLGCRLWGAGRLYQGGLTSTLAESVAGNLHGWIALGNLFFVQGLYVPSLGSNGPLWSLANEFWYYLLFPLLVLALVGKKGWLRRALCVVLMVVIGLIVRQGVLVYFVVWLMGAMLAYAPRWSPRKAWQHKALLLGASGLVVASATWQIVCHDYAYELDLLLAVACVLLLWAVLQIPARQLGGRYGKAAHRLAAMSYTLYLFHFPFVLFLAGWLHPNELWQPKGWHMAISLGVCLLTMFYAALMYLCFEKQTDKMRGWLKLKLACL